MCRRSLRKLVCLSLVTGAACVGCGGKGTDEQRPTPPEYPVRVFDDPGSLPTYDCNADQPNGGITLRMIQDWEYGAGAGWYTNNDKCEGCQNATNLILSGIDAGARWDADRIDAGLQGRTACFDECYASQTPSYFAKPVPAEQIPGGRCASRYAFHVSSGPFTKWGGQIGINFTPPLCLTGDCICNLDDLARCPDYERIDGGPWDGIAFWARVAPGSGQTMRVQVGESHTDNKYPYTADGLPPCANDVSKTSPDDTSGGCDSFGAYAQVNTDWQFFTLPFAEMRQAGWGKRAPFLDIQHLSNLTFFYAQGTWSIWIDDIAFYKRSVP